MEKLRKRKTKNKTTRASLTSAQMQTQVLTDEFNAGMGVVDKIKKQRNYMLAQVKLELQAQKDLRAKIELLKKEYKLMQLSYDANEKILQETQHNRTKLEEEVNEVESALRKAKGNDKSLMVTNDFARLIEVINLDGRGYQKEKSVLFTCVRDIVKTTQENEFEGFNWRAKFASSNKALGLRVRFDQLSIGQGDLKLIYRPVIEALALKFKKYNLRVQTKTKSANGVVTQMDITLKMPANLKTVRVQESSPQN